jgi:hypothetical protein
MIIGKYFENNSAHILYVCVNKQASTVIYLFQFNLLDIASTSQLMLRRCGVQNLKVTFDVN